MNTCPKCGSGVTAVPQDYEYTFNPGFSVTLRGIQVLHCHRCDARAPVIPNVLGLHRFVAQRLSAKQSRLTPGEAAYLREFIQDAPVRSPPLLRIASRIASGRIPDMVLKFLAFQECNRQREADAGLESGRRISLAPQAESEGYTWASRVASAL